MYPYWPIDVRELQHIHYISQYTHSQEVYTYGIRVGGFVISVGLSVGLCEGEKVGDTDGFSVGASVLEDMKKDKLV